MGSTAETKEYGDIKRSLESPQPDSCSSIGCMSRDEKELLAKPALLDKELLAKSSDLERASSQPVAEPTKDVPQNESSSNGELHGLPLIAITISIMLCVFILELDKTVTTTAAPKITAGFGALYDIGWYGTGYMITYMALQPIFGKLFTFFSIRFMFTTAIVLFELGSIICALAPTSPVFIFGRAVAGIGAAGQISGSITIIGYTVPLRKRPMYYSIINAMTGVTALSGPVIGGAFTDAESLTWRWCFWINPPLGGFCLLLFLLTFRAPKQEHIGLDLRQKLAKMDPLGAVLFIAASVCLLLGLQWGGENNSWAQSRVWGCLLGFVLIIGAFSFLQVQLKDDAMIPPRILSQVSVVLGCLFATLLPMGNFVHTYFLPFYFQSVRGYSAQTSGLLLIPYLISIVVASIVAGAIVTATGQYRLFMALGAALFAIGSGLLFMVQPATTAAIWIVGQILAGSGIGSSGQLTAIAIQALIPQADMPIANGLIMLMMILGGVLGLAVGESVFSATLTEGLSGLGLSSNVASEVTTGAANLRNSVPAALFNGVQNTFDFAITRAFIVPIVAGILSFAIVWGIKQKSLKGEAESPPEKITEKA